MLAQENKASIEKASHVKFSSVQNSGLPSDRIKIHLESEDWVSIEYTREELREVYREFAENNDKIKEFKEL